MEGKCTKGDSCTFSHALKPNKTAEEARSSEVCKYHVAGACLKGEDCLFSHDLTRVPCKFFHVHGECSATTGRLKGGGPCRFSHAPLTQEQRHSLFAETMGTHDPRLPPPAPPANVYVLRPPVARRPPPPDPVLAALLPTLSPAVAALNPFGSPFL